jgi:hypothetical protein
MTLKERKENFIQNMNLSELEDDCDCIIIKRSSYLGFPKKLYLEAMSELRATLAIDNESPLANLVVYLLEEAMITGYKKSDFKK